MHEHSIFLTLTYADEHLKSPWLQYIDWQLFIKSLRSTIDRDTKDKELREKLRISYIVTGEYGDKNKRPHWHAILFNYCPNDAVYDRKTELGHHVFGSKFLTDLWGKGKVEFGSVTLESASYVARYAAKKLAHGHDEDHKYHPIHKTSSKRAIGRSFIERNFTYTFENGNIILPNYSPAKIPRYYVDWCRKHNPEAYIRYVTEVRPKIMALAEAKQQREEWEYYDAFINRANLAPPPLTKNKVRMTLLKSKFKKLQERLHL